MDELTHTLVPAADQQPEQARSEIDRISDLLLGKEPPAVEDAPPPENGETPADPEKEEPPAAAEKVPEKAEIDYGMKVPITGGEPVTLGELKDAYQAQAVAKLEIQERENKVLQASDEAKLLLSYIDDLPPHVRDAAIRQAATDYKREGALLVEAIPEMRTAAGAREVKSRLYELGKEYGVPSHAIDGIRDATTIKMMHDYAQLKSAVKAARMNVKPLRSTTAKPQPGKVTPANDLDEAIAKAKASRSQSDKVAAIDKLLRA